MSSRSSPGGGGGGGVGGGERTPDMRERRKPSLQNLVCVFFLRTRYFTLTLTMDHFVVENKQKKHRLAAGFFGQKKKKHRLPVYRALKTGRRILRSDSTDNCIVSRSRRN